MFVVVAAMGFGSRLLHLHVSVYVCSSTFSIAVYTHIIPLEINAFSPRCLFSTAPVHCDISNKLVCIARNIFRNISTQAVWMATSQKAGTTNIDVYCMQLSYVGLILDFAYQVAER